jgi:uncharacterized membrane protein YdjX (TVP38/TMEM64 family)
MPADPPASPEPDGHPPLIGVAITLVGIAVLAALVLAIEPLRAGIGEALSGDTAALREEIRGLEFGGVLIVLALAIAHAVVWYPAEILDAAVGFVYGFWAGMALVMAGWMLNAIVAYWIGRHAARPLLWRVIGHERFEHLERIAETGGAAMLLTIRLIPIVPFSLFSIVAGAARVPHGRFMWTTAVGYIPITAVFVYLGTQLEELSPTDPILWIGAIVLIALVVLTHRLRHLIRTPDDATAPTSPSPDEAR